jgi:hypothetical protein
VENVLPFETEEDTVLVVRFGWDADIVASVLGVIEKRWGIRHGEVVDIYYLCFCLRLAGSFVVGGSWISFARVDIIVRLGLDNLVLRILVTAY